MTNFVVGFTKRNLKILNNFEKLEVWKLDGFTQRKLKKNVLALCKQLLYKTQKLCSLWTDNTDG